MIRHRISPWLVAITAALALGAGAGRLPAQEVAPEDPTPEVAAPPADAPVEAEAPTAPDQEPGASAPEDEAVGLFFDTVDVNVVNIDVYVTDKAGNRVLGLTKDDFELYEEKRPVTITNFYAVEDGKPVIEQAGQSTGGVEAPEAPVPQDEVDIPEDQRLHLVVYIDNWNIKPFSRNRIFRYIREFLRTQLSVGDRVMLVTYDREPHVRREFTSDPIAIASALFELEELSGYGVRLEGDRREILNDIAEARNRSGIEARVRAYAESLYNDLTFSIRSVKELVDTLAGLPGRKAVLYVSEGLEMVPGEDVYYALQEATGGRNLTFEARNYDLSRKFTELANAANANRVSFYTIDAAGLRVSTRMSVEQRNPGGSALVDSVYWGNLHGSIRLMADRTGGVSVVNTNDPTAGLTRMAEDFKNYYSLGYSPARAADGRYHKVDVKVKDKSYQVRHRDGYRDKPVETRMSDGVRSALHFNFADNTMGLQIDRGSEERRDNGHYVVNVSVRIPIAKLVMIPQGERYYSRMKLFIGAVDEKGRTSDISETRIPFDIPAEELELAQAGFYRYDVPLLMRQGAQRLAVGLRDEVGQTQSFAVKTILVGE